MLMFAWCALAAMSSRPIADASWPGGHFGAWEQQAIRAVAEALDQQG